MPKLDRWIRALMFLYGLDRGIKTALIRHFFAQPRAKTLAPTNISVIQPITRGVHDLARNLRSRLQLNTTHQVQHVWICDELDHVSQQVCRELLAHYPQHTIKLVIVPAINGESIASKPIKMQAGLDHADAEIVLFLDDDVMLHPNALDLLLPPLDLPDVGAVFGMACYTNWRTVWSSAVSIFVNANVLQTYIPITYVTDPFTITGHCFALHRAVFERIGGIRNMDHRIDDDHELARRVQQHGLRSVQTPLIYGVDNDLVSWQAYNWQMHRWFIFPRRLMIPMMRRRDQIISAITSAGMILPSMIVSLSMLNPKRYWRYVGGLVGMIGVLYAHDSHYLANATPLRRWWLVPLIVIFAPLQALKSLLHGDTFQWRGRTLRIKPGGSVETIDDRGVDDRR